jgi:protein arginine N-methyltransferase 1
VPIVPLVPAPNAQSRASLPPETLLKRAPDINVRVRSDNEIEMSAGDGWLVTGSHGLAILDTFARATSLQAALDTLAARGSGAMAFIEMSSTIIAMARAGILRDESAVRPAYATDRKRFDAAWIHVAMLNDRARTSAYLHALRDVVRPGDVVLDVGTGTGVLAIAAAQAGARHVYAIESTSIGRAAAALFEANGLADRITLVEGHSTRISLPTRADVLVSEIIGSDPLGEHALEVMFDAVQRLLTPDARIIPAELALYAIPVQVPDEVLERNTFTTRVVENWRAWYGIDFSPLTTIADRSPHQIMVRPNQLGDYAVLGEPVMILHRRFRDQQSPVVETRTSFAVARGGRLSGILLFFELALSPSTRLSTDPAHVRLDNHWRHAVWAMPEPYEAREGDRFELGYRHGADGDAIEVTRTAT